MKTLEILIFRMETYFFGIPVSRLIRVESASAPSQTDGVDLADQLGLQISPSPYDNRLIVQGPQGSVQFWAQEVVETAALGRHQIHRLPPLIMRAQKTPLLQAMAQIGDTVVLLVHLDSLLA